MLRRLMFLLTATAIALPATALTTIEKPPDLGPFWQPLSPNGGTYVYSDCFVAPAGADIHVQALGTWLQELVSGGVPEGSATRPDFVPEGGSTPDVRFEIWGDAGGPDAGNVLATTGTLSPEPTGLELVTAPVQLGATPLTPGQVYWFAATVVGEQGTGAYQVGGHTQNSVYPDNCTFWYSNDPAGVNFDGQNLTPEMPFSVTLDEVPLPVELLSISVE